MQTKSTEPESSEADVVRDAGLAYRDTDEHGREIYCPACLAYYGNKGYVGITNIALYQQLPCPSSCLGVFFLLLVDDAVVASAGIL